MKVSIVIPVYNNLELTKNCINSILKAKNSTSYEIIISDDCSTDNTKEFCLSLTKKYKNIKYRRNEKNMGFSFTCNRGAEISEGEYLLFLNNDTIVKDYFIDNFFIAFEKFKNVGIIGGKLLYEDNTIQHAGVIIFPDNKVDHLFRYFPKDYKNANNFYEFSAVTGACLLISKNLFKKLNYFDENFINGFEDIDLCYSAKKLGYKVIYNPKVEIYHLEEKTREPKEKDTFNSQYLFNKWNGKFYPDFWLIDLGYNFKFTEYFLCYIVKQKILKENELPENISYVYEIFKNEPLEFNACKKVINHFLNKREYNLALSLLKDLIRFEPTLENFYFLKKILKISNNYTVEIEDFIKNYERKMIDNKKLMRKISLKLLKEKDFRRGIYFAEWLKNYVGDYSSYKIFVNFLEIIKKEDFKFYKLWENCYEPSKKKLLELKEKIFAK